MEQRTIDDGELRQWIDEWGEESHDDILPSDDEADIANRILEHHTRGEYAGDVDWNGAWESLRSIVGPALEHVHGFFPDGAETLARYVREIGERLRRRHRHAGGRHARGRPGALLRSGPGPYRVRSPR